MGLLRHALVPQCGFMDPLLVDLSDSVTGARTLEDLARPLLEMLEAVTGMESTYLTLIDAQMGVQHVLYARNTGALQIPEGLDVPWGDTLCKRALEEGRPYTDNVPACWGDSDAARQLGLQTYVSSPIVSGNGDLYGTLCAASAERLPLDARAEKVLRLFSKLVAQHIERERLLERLQQANAMLAEAALTDPLTGLANRRQLIHELTRMLARSRRDDHHVLVAYIDLDGFKAVNDLHGHDAGDALLAEAARRMGATLREGDLLARIGGDEFAVVAPGPAMHGESLVAAQALCQRLAAAVQGEYQLGRLALSHAGASVGAIAVPPRSMGAAEALQAADAAMYRVKHHRRGHALPGEAA